MEERQYPYYTPEVNELFAALAQARIKFETASKDSKGGFGKYIKLDGVLSAVIPALSEFGLFVKQDVGYDNEIDWLYTTVCHKSGQYSISRLALRTAGPDMQKLGAAITYARRYAICAVLSFCADEDDDGNSNLKSFESQQKSNNQLQKPIQSQYTKPSDEDLQFILSSTKEAPIIVETVLRELKIEDFSKITADSATKVVRKIKELKGK